MKSLFGKIILGAGFFLGLVLSAQLVLAQSTSTNTANYSQADLKALNNIPSVEISALTLTKNEYKGGDTVSGHFTISNDRDYNLPGLTYKISLAGKYDVTGLAGVYYDSKVYGPIFLPALGKETVNFSYVLPKNVAGDKLGIQVQAFTSAGTPLSWGDVFIKVSGSMSFLSVIDAYVEIDGRKFGLGEGPGLTVGREGSINVKLQNDISKDVILVPEVKVYDRTITGKLLKSTKLANLTVSTNKSAVFKTSLDSFENTPGVYEATLTFTDGSGLSVATPLSYRYLVLGETATIQHVSIDKNSVKAGEDFNLTIGYSGSPYDITTGRAPTSKPLNLTALITNGKGESVASYNGLWDFNKGLSLTLPLKALVAANNLIVKISVTNDQGKVITSYESSVTGANKNETSFDTIALIAITFIALLLIVIVSVYRYRHNRRTPTFLVLFFIFAASFGLFDVAKANSIQWLAGAQMINGVPTSVTTNPSFVSVSITSPASTLSPGEEFFVTGNVTTVACTNSPAGLTGLWTDAMPADTSFAFSVDNSYSYGKVVSSTAQYDPNVHTFAFFSNNFSLSRDLPESSVPPTPFIAPSTPGVYRIYLKVKVDMNSSAPGQIVNVQAGYIEFTVKTPITEPPPAPDPLTATCSVSPDGDAVIDQTTVVWTANPSGGSNSYTYSWTGDGFVNNQTTKTVSGVYTTLTPETKRASILVRDSAGATTTVACPGTSLDSVGSGGSGGGKKVIPAIVNGVCISPGEYPSRPDHFCYSGTISWISDGKEDGPWSWSCLGSNGGTSTLNCAARKEPSNIDPNLNCTLRMFPNFSQVEINTKTTWISDSVNQIYNDNPRQWKINDANTGVDGETIPDKSGASLDKILNTIGTKTLSARIASTTPPFYGAWCSATTTVVQIGSGTRER